MFAIEIFLILLIAALTLIENQEMPTAYAVKENQNAENNNFSILTKAVCEEKDEHIFCSDKLFVICNEKELIVDEDLRNFKGCNNLSLNLSYVSVKGDVMFRKGWIDSRK